MKLSLIPFCAEMKMFVSFMFLCYAFFGVLGVSSLLTSSCNYYQEQNELLSIIFGLVPGQYAVDYCAAVYIGPNEGSSLPLCDADDLLYYEVYDDDYCEGNVNHTYYSNDTSGSDYTCDSRETCEVYTVAFDIYNGSATCNRDNEYFGVEYSVLVSDNCFPLTVFGFTAGYGTVSFTSSSYILKWYYDSSCSLYYTNLTIEEGCTGNETTQTSLRLKISAGAGSGSSKQTTLFSFIFCILCCIVCIANN